MIYRIPSRKKRTRTISKLNLTSILDAVFIFIFFLLFTSNLIKIFEISSNVPIISNSPPNKKIPLALTLKITEAEINLYTGIPSQLRKSFPKDLQGEYDLESLREYLLDLKIKNVEENTAIFEPLVDLEYDKLIKIMDTVRLLRNTDPAIFKKDKDGLDVKIKELFSDIIFGNIQS